MVDSLAFVGISRGFFGGLEPEHDSALAAADDDLADAITLTYMRHHLAKRDWAAARELFRSLGERVGPFLSSPLKADALGRTWGTWGSWSSRGVGGSSGGGTLLHALCSVRSPPDMIRTVADSFPKLVEERDDMGRTALHVAVERAEDESDLAVVRYLLAKYPQGAETKDLDGTTPLMRACDKMSAMGPDGRKQRRRGSSDRASLRFQFALVQNLALAAPRSVVVEDDEERTALERSILSCAPAAVVRLLQRVTVDVNRGTRNAFQYELWAQSHIPM